VSPNLKQLAADVRRVWTPPAPSAWGRDVVAIMKLLKAIEAMPDAPPAAPAAVDRNAILDEVIAEIEAAYLLDEDIAAIDVVRVMKR
jgi:hypothetical protein